MKLLYSFTDVVTTYEARYTYETEDKRVVMATRKLLIRIRWYIAGWSYAYIYT